MKSIRRVPVFEQLEQKLLLAADVFEQDPVDVPPVLGTVPIVAAQLEVTSELFGASAGLQSALATDEVQALNGEDDEDGVQETEDDSDEIDDEDDMEEEDTDDDSDDNETDDDETDDDETDDDETDDDETDDDETDDDETDDDETDDDETDDDETDDDETDDDETDDDETDDDETDDDETDDDETDDDETDVTANLTGTGTGTAQFASETDDGSTERDLTIEVTGTTPGTHAVKIGTITVGNIVVGTDGTGILELSSDPDEEETLLPDTVTSVEGMTVMVGTVLMGTFPTSAAATTSTLAQSPDTTANPLLLAASDAASHRQALQDGNGFESALAQPIAIDATAVDLLLAIIGNDELDEPESTEFVGRSDQRDAASEVLEVAYESEEGDFESPEEPSHRS